MIKVVYHPEHLALSVEGHAYSGEEGRDLVCCAVSTLAYTLAANAEKLKASGAGKDIAIELEPGKAFIRCSPATRMKSVVALVFGSVCMGFQLLARDFPKYISYEIIGG